MVEPICTLDLLESNSSLSDQKKKGKRKKRKSNGIVELDCIMLALLLDFFFKTKWANGLWNGIIGKKESSV